jgi:stage II sporulation protein D
LDDQQQVLLSATAPATIREGANPSAARLVNLPPRTPVAVARTPAGWQVGDTAFAAGELTLQASAPGTLRVNGQAHRGQYRLIPAAAPGKFDVINDVDLDAYLKGVLAKEMLRDWMPEAYAAQAVAARTYTLFEIKSSGAGRSWDLHPDTRSQMYGGIDGETALSRNAVDQTAGVVLGYGPPGQERIFKAYYSSCCGGIGQSPADAFGEPSVPPLMDQNVGARCNHSKWFNWATPPLPKDELTRRFRLWGERKGRPEKAIARIERIDVQGVNRSGRPVRFLVTDARGVRFSVSGEDLRWAVNTDAPPGTDLRSSFCTPVNESHTIRFVDGHGFGHGVGLCQYCAEQQAEAHLRHEQILANAYPGAKLLRAY